MPNSKPRAHQSDTPNPPDFRRMLRLPRTATRTSCPSDRTRPRCPRRREVPAHGRVVPQLRSRAHRRSSHRRHRRSLASCLPRAESSHGVVRCTRSPISGKGDGPPAEGAGDHPSTRQGITHLSGNSCDCSGHRSGRTYHRQTGEARATDRRKSSLRVSPRRARDRLCALATDT
jgi:hypothetical protein